MLGATGGGTAPMLGLGIPPILARERCGGGIKGGGAIPGNVSGGAGRGGGIHG